MIMTVKARTTINDHVTWLKRGHATSLPEVAGICDTAFQQGFDRVLVETPQFSGVLEFDAEDGLLRRTGVFA